MGSQNTDVVASLVHTISTHTSDVNGVVFSSNKKLASCSGDKSVRLWNIDDFSEEQCSPLLGHTYYVHCCAFSLDGCLLASCSTDGNTIIWDVSSGQKRCVLQHSSNSPIRVIRFSPDSSQLLTGGDDTNVCLWEVATGKSLMTYQGHEGTIFGLDFTPNSQYIVSGSSDGDLVIWDARFGHGKPLYLTLGGHDLGVMWCEFSPTYGTKGIHSDPSCCNYMLATCGHDDLVKTWFFNATSNKQNLKEWRLMKGHGGTVMQCRFSPDGKLLASGSSDKTVRLWDPEKGLALHVIQGHTRYVTCVAFSVDGSLLASGSNDKTVMIWRLESELKLHTIDTGGLTSPTAPKLTDIDTSSSVDMVKPNQWSVAEVCAWLHEIGLEKYVDTFQSQDIDGTELFSLTNSQLQNDLGIGSLGHRNKILRCRGEVLNQQFLQTTSQKSKNAHVLDSGVPDEYLCPITRELMKDPVICCDGYSYERSAITSWMEKGHDRSPMTNAILTSKELTPNRSLKMIIQNQHSKS